MRLHTGNQLMLFFLMLLAVRGQEAAAAQKPRILILCTGNSARSQMAAGLLGSLDSRLDIYSAGTAPAPKINPNAVRVMKEVGIDISGGVPKSVTQFLGQSFDFVITVCDDADKNCPAFQGKVGRRVHIPFVDPAKATGSEQEVLAVFRKVRDQIKDRFTDFYAKEIKPVAVARFGSAN
jgi:arsenate reductase (thioredoxin)